ncbi:MAG TPA: hypothetical protein VK279_04070 [Solirubrobacteraceae bacterium]|nr:hypothetical protein [Solirubrobacteraceae bacterium]
MAHQAVQHILASPLLDRVAQDLSTHEVAQRIATPLLADGVVEELAARVADDIADSPQMEAEVARVVDSPLLDEVVARMLESDDLWRLVDAIAKSEPVTEAISQQGIGFAGEVAEEVRERSRRGDARLESLARRMLRRTPRQHAPPPALQEPG